MPKISLDMPSQLTEDLRKHVGDDKKFVSLADAVRTACRKLLDQLDEIDLRGHPQMTSPFFFSFALFLATLRS